MRFSSGEDNILAFSATVMLVLAVVFVTGACNDSTPPPVEIDNPPKILAFTIDSTCFNRSYVPTLDFDATDDIAIDSAVVDFGDGGRDVFTKSQRHYSVVIKRQYQYANFFLTTLTVYDKRLQTDRRALSVNVYPDSIPCPMSQIK